MAHDARLADTRVRSIYCGACLGYWLIFRSLVCETGEQELVAGAVGLGGMALAAYLNRDVYSG
jgi:hypothetical protein